ncbi:DUF2808 domain-containing protein [Chroococcidiopsis sp. CCNUC1]|uniref:DUF2808 domain-containing protein n=1 Tax=Chroococcidiopsis sp. CCNUC1 TaxID=2653189 RepID=UPI0020218D80|nr:DUF2808 domain-containing protein [Chroococcidiopsis sp. CCNUC1]URD53458.1 DUF2808 domain-containing protein [Chroococcidiopsis sp. CCNUC1]
MLKPLIYATALSLTAAVSVPSVYAIPATDAMKVPHIVSSVQFPQSKASIVRHTFRLQIPPNSKSLSQLTIDVPAGLKVKNKIDVSDRSGRQIDTNTSVDGSKVTLVFPTPVSPGNELKIAMRDVKISGITNAWLYKVYARLVGIDADLPIGFARYRVYVR